MKISIIICTYNRYDQIGNCLESFSSAIGNRKNMEVVVVDNTRENDRRAIPLPLHTRVVYSSPPGLAHARNEGIRASEGDIIAFVDDDTICGPGWLDACLRSFDESDEIGIVGGKVVPETNGAAIPYWFYDDLWLSLSCLDWSPTGRYLKSGEWIVGANMAFRRSVFEQFGNFTTALGRIGTGGLLSNEEIALIEKYGIERVWYCPEMVLRHVIPIDRISPQWFRKRVFWQAISDELLGTRVQHPSELLRILDDDVAKMHPRYRGLKTFFREPVNAPDFKKQLQSLYDYVRFCAAGGEP